MERATEPDDMVDCLLHLCNGNLKFQPVPKGILDWVRNQVDQGNGNGVILTIDNVPYAVKDIYFRFFTGGLCLN